MAKTDFTSSMSQDIHDLIAQISQLEDKFNSNEISSKKYANMRYVYACKAGFLLEVVEEAHMQGTVFDNASDYVILSAQVDELIDAIDIHNVNELNEEEQSIIKDIAIKYQDIIPLEESFEV